MAINAGPKIVEDGLVFYVDAANKRVIRVRELHGLT